MFNPIKIADINISPESGNLSDLKDLGEYKRLKGLVRWDRIPVGYIEVPVTGGRVSKDTLVESITARHSEKLFSIILQKRFEKIKTEELQESGNDFPLVTIAVCTRNRTENLVLCIDSLLKLKYPNLEIIIVDNAPEDYSTKTLVKQFAEKTVDSLPGQFRTINYICETIPGLDWARNRAIKEAEGDIIAFTDDDVVVDEYWVDQLVKVFNDSADVMAVTGLVVPYQLENFSEFLFEKYGGFGRGFNRIWYRWSGIDEEGKKEKASKFFAGTGKFGTGANMAFRKKVFEKAGIFDPSLDVGTPSNGGGDLEIFFRIIKAGFTLVYEPGAVVRHRHRETYRGLKEQLRNNGIGFYAYLTRSFIFYKDERFRLFYLGAWWFFYWNLRRLFLSIIKPGYFPPDLVWAELKGSVKGIRAYFKSRKAAKKLACIYNSPIEYLPVRNTREFFEKYHAKKRSVLKTADLFDFRIPKENFEEFYSSRIILLGAKDYISKIQIKNNYSRIGRMRLNEEIFKSVSPSFFGLPDKLTAENFENVIASYSAPFLPHIRKRLGNNVKVSIIIPTYDRPEELMICLNALSTIKKERETEVIVVDNNPASQSAAGIVNQFENVKLIPEEKKGLSSARNRGIKECTGEIAVCIDDDIIVSSLWLENLLEPFNNPNVMCVTGNVLSFEMETKAERLFELYGGLGRGDSAAEYGPEWFNKNKFYSLPTWELGATANAAFRTRIFSEEKIGLLNEVLGAGTPSGCSEDTYLFYKILKAGFNIYYQPSAYVFHKHRKTKREFYRQIFNYSKGHVAYNLLTFFSDKDKRGLVRILYELPLSHLLKIKRRVLKQTPYPLILTIIEILGNLIGPLALIRSIIRLRTINQKVKLNSGSNQSAKIIYKTS